MGNAPAKLSDQAIFDDLYRMTHTYTVSGMTCSGCENTVREKLENLDGVSKATVSKDSQTATISMTHHISRDQLQEAIGHGKYTISEKPADVFTQAGEETSYKPIFIVFAFILGITLLLQWRDGWNAAVSMREFMAGFFLVFSFFKMLDLRGFAESYAMYDIVAKRFAGWGYIYAFIELALGIAFLTGIMPLVTNVVTLAVMGVSIIGVLQSVLNKRRIRCACLGAVFNLPMSTITIIEDGLMISMSALMIYRYI